MRHTGNRIGGSNPPLSARFFSRKDSDMRRSTSSRLVLRKAAVSSRARATVATGALPWGWEACGGAFFAAAESVKPLHGCPEARFIAVVTLQLFHVDTVWLD
tara:strand:+ start:762 stop:1067 length:306 start_codon:yes stop_codon:yes gene_type:complete